MTTVLEEMDELCPCVLSYGSTPNFTQQEHDQLQLIGQDFLRTISNTADRTRDLLRASIWVAVNGLDLFTDEASAAEFVVDKRRELSWLGDDLRGRFAWGGPRIYVADQTVDRECSTDMWRGMDSDFFVPTEVVSLLRHQKYLARAKVYLTARLLRGTADGIRSAHQYKKIGNGHQLVRAVGEPNEHSRPSDIAEWIAFGGRIDFDFSSSELHLRTSATEYVVVTETAARLWISAGLPHLGRFLAKLDAVSSTSVYLREQIHNHREDRESYPPLFGNSTGSTSFSFDEVMERKVMFGGAAQL
ncbi:hypothetical protein K438DRAFT_2071789 [Mycena galopus ATCC 62051]|nr:hypothetical protein K438DRAFT_2071789 [Mycena galopus ATCC 62051]